MTLRNGPIHWYMGTRVELYRMAKKAILALLGFPYTAFSGAKLYSFCEVTSISLLLCVGIKVVDEWQISLDYVRGSNIYGTWMFGFTVPGL